MQVALAINTFTIRRGIATLAYIVVLVIGCNRSACGQEHAVFQPADTSSPYATLNSFIDACNDFHDIIQEDRYFDRTSREHRPTAMKILDCIDQSKLPEYGRLELAGEAATCLKEILDRVELPPDEDIPGFERANGEEGQEDVPVWRVPGTRITIARVEEGPQRHEYLFSPGTVSRAKQYYQDMQALPYREHGRATSPGLFEWYMHAPGHPGVAKIVDQLPQSFRQRLFNVAIWQWVGFLITLAAAVALLALLKRLHGQVAKRLHGVASWTSLVTLVFPVLAILVPLALQWVTYNLLTVRGEALMKVSFACNLAALLISLFVVFGLFNRIAATVIASPQINPQGLDAQFIRILCRLLAILAAVVVFLEGGNYLGIPISTLIASAGIGGLAIALAAQDTLRNVFGTIMLLSDKPFRVGERIIFGKYDGIVEEIGLRSTRIRLLTGHQASIPNDELARNDIENVGRRPYIRRVSDIHIPLNTPRERLELAVASIRKSLEDHEGMDPDYPPRVFFIDFGESAFVIRMIYWYHPPNYWDFLAMGEAINFQIFRALDEQGIAFTLPLRVAPTNLESENVPLEVKLTGGESAA